MTTTTVSVTIDGEVADDLQIGYELIGEGGRTWVITPGGRFGRDSPGIRETAAALAELGHRVLILDRPNCGESDVCFHGSSESAMQADALAALLRALGLAPAIVTGGSGGARVSVLLAARHPDVVSALALWWMTGGVYGLLKVGMNYGGQSVEAAWMGDMAPVLELAEWQEVLEKNPRNRARFLAQDPATFIGTIERWIAVHFPQQGELVPGLPDVDARRIEVPALVLRNGRSDPVHTAVTTDRLAGLLPNAELVDPPWPDDEAVASKPGFRFVGWPALAPALDDWARRLES